MQAYLLEAERVVLRPLEESDANADYLSWLNDSEVTRHLVGVRVPYTHAQLQDYLQRFKTSSSDFIFAIVDRRSSLHIGNVTLNNVSSVHRTADTGIMIGRREFWGKGYAFEAWSLAIEYGFLRLGLEKIIAGATVENVASIVTMKKLGFKEEGLLRRHFLMEGERRDAVLLGLLREEFHKFSRDERGSHVPAKV